MLWRRDNIEYFNEQVREWKLNNPKKIIEYTRRRRAKKIEVQESYSIEDEQFTRNLFENKCFNCSTDIDINIDHNYPLSAGFALTRENAVCLCKSCNSSKGAKMPEDFYSEEKLTKLNKIVDTVKVANPV